jgi:hypothetical protein
VRVERLDGVPVVCEHLAPGESGRYELDVVLAPGSYRIEASSFDGRRAETTLEVAPGSGPLGEIELELR